MKFRLLYFLPVLIISASQFTGCKKIYEEPLDPENEIFNFLVTESQRQFINSSRGENFEVTDPVPGLEFAGNSYTLNRFEIRGESTLDFERKGFGVNMDRKITLLNPDEGTERKYEEFKLLAMVYDYTYIENSTAVRLFKEVDMWPVYSFFTEVKLNGHTQGLYHFVEDPVEYFIEQRNASYVIRRGYDHVVKSSSSGSQSLYEPQRYLANFKKIYSIIADYSGRQLFDSLTAYMDLEQYFTKLSIDMLVKNGDYTDEVFFYTKMVNNKEIFGVFPWDYDDIFADKPHEIGRAWAVGTVFGTRKYSSMADIISDVGSKLLFSIEDDLDYKIAKDSVLYQQYLKTLRSVMLKIDLGTIDKIFDYTFEHISPFYKNDSIVDQSRFDVKATTYDLFTSNLEMKRQILRDRRELIIQQLDLQQNR